MCTSRFTQQEISKRVFIDSQEFSSSLNVTMRVDLVKTSKDTSICKTQQTAILAYIIGELMKDYQVHFPHVR